LGAQETGKTPTKPFSGAGNRTITEIIDDYVHGNYGVLRELDDAYAYAAEQVLATANTVYRPATREPLNYNYIYSIEDVDLPF
jgi:hypothetical protein